MADANASTNLPLGADVPVSLRSGGSASFSLPSGAAGGLVTVRLETGDVNIHLRDASLSQSARSSVSGTGTATIGLQSGPQANGFTLGLSSQDGAQMIVSLRPASGSAEPSPAGAVPSPAGVGRGSTVSTVSSSFSGTSTTVSSIVSSFSGGNASVSGGSASSSSRGVVRVTSQTGASGQGAEWIGVNTPTGSDGRVGGGESPGEPGQGQP